MVLYRAFGLTAKQAARIVAEVVRMIDRRMKDSEMLGELKEKFSGEEAIFAAFTLGRIVGLSFAVKDIEAAKSIVSDLARYLEIYRKEGIDRLTRVVEKEILEETYREVEKIRDVV